MTVNRAKLSQNKLENNKKALRREMAHLLREDKEEKARIKAEQFLQDQKMECALDILETMCDLLATRMRYIESEKDCPSDLSGTIASVLYCEKRAGIDDLAEVRKQFEIKYGREFVETAADNKNQEVHFKLVQLLSVMPPAEHEVVKVLKDVAAEYDVQWNAPPEPAEPSLSDFNDMVHEATEGGDAFVPRPSAPGPYGYPFPVQVQGGMPMAVPYPPYPPQQQQQPVPSGMPQGAQPSMPPPYKSFVGAAGQFPSMPPPPPGPPAMMGGGPGGGVSDASAASATLQDKMAYHDSHPMPPNVTPQPSPSPFPASSDSAAPPPSGNVSGAPPPVQTMQPPAGAQEPESQVAVNGGFPPFVAGPQKPYGEDTQGGGNDAYDLNQRIQNLRR
ncbi:unnamed protein product [Vitrella brassicaformis CCMP3155]|uniref:IST1 homolog n=1 Tax=Vitrella brassicaformis (strain CCMP3155) TaxID=1169540 RepID=A0A0G4E8J1_VITBC|nr:unnamed protein product [Vitrella brassicaformis CCMP3155]|eukprot:CEL92099.1 unnamed protein product [Vitrella brassicaformis CCMP3155]